MFITTCGDKFTKPYAPIARRLSLISTQATKETVMAYATPMSRRAALTISAAALAGTAVSIPSAIAAAPKAAGAEADTLLIDAWAKYRAAMAHNDALNAKIEPLYQAAPASLPPHLEQEEFLRLSEEAQQAYRKERMYLYQEAFDKLGVTALQEEQDHFLTTVADPLAVLIRNTVPSTLQGAAIKAAYLLEYERHEIFRTDRPQDLNWDERGLRLFVEQLAALSAGEA
jgi:hypothetical protein